MKRGKDRSLDALGFVAAPTAKADGQPARRSISWIVPRLNPTSATMRRRDVLAGIASLATSLPSWAAVAAGIDYPRQPIRLVVPRSAGGGGDFVSAGGGGRVQSTPSNNIA